MKKVLLITPVSQHVVGFRKNLIEALQKEGHKVALLTFDDEYKSVAEQNGIEFYNVVGSTNRSVNPFRLLSLKSRFYKIIKKIAPDTVVTFSLKPNTFGVFAAKKAGVKDVYCFMEGGGDVFINNGFKWKLIRAVVCKLYRKSFRMAKKVFFLNNDDKAEFIQRKLVTEEKCEIIHGIGVDLEKFSYKPIKNFNTFLMVARMLKTKGVFEYCECARRVKKKHPEAIFNYVGGEGSAKISDIQEYIEDGSVNYIGLQKDVRPYYEDCSVFVLPSYREGFPVAVMEAESVGRAVLLTETNGCKETVIEGENGFFVPCFDVEKLTEKAIWFIENPEKVVEMGNNARKLAEENFDQKKLTEQTIFAIGVNQ